MKYANIIAELYSSAWAILPRKLEAIVDVIESREAGGDHLETDAEFKAYESNYDLGAQTSGNVVGVVPLVGTIVNRAGAMQQHSGAQSPQAFADAVRALADHDPVTHVILDIDSPGGTVAGTEIASDAVNYAKSKGKKVIAAISGTGASAAYWVASQADEIYVQETSAVGSIGAMMIHRSTSEKDKEEGIKTTVIRSGENKALGHSSEPMTDKAMASMQAMVNSLHDVFVKTVVAGRGIDETWLRENVADGRVFIGAEAISAGLADGFGTVDSVVQNLTRDKTMADMPNAEHQAELLAASEREAALIAKVAEMSTIAEGLRAQLVAYQQAEVVAFVDSEILGKGKAVAASRDQLIADATADLAFVTRMYAAIPDFAVANVAPDKTIADDNSRLSTEETLVEAVTAQLNF